MHVAKHECPSAHIHVHLNRHFTLVHTHTHTDRFFFWWQMNFKDERSTESVGVRKGPIPVVGNTVYSLYGKREQWNTLERTHYTWGFQIKSNHELLHDLAFSLPNCAGERKEIKELHPKTSSSVAHCLMGLHNSHPYFLPTFLYLFLLMLEVAMCSLVKTNLFPSISGR